MHLSAINSPLTDNEYKEYLDDLDRISSLYPVLENLTIKIEWSNRLKTSAGNVKCKQDAFFINLSVKLVKAFGADRGLNTLRHEIAHIIGLLKDGKFSHNKYFKSVCQVLGGTMNEQMAGKMFSDCASGDYIKSSYKYQYTCPCGKVIKTKGKIRKIYNRSCLNCYTQVANMKLEKI